MTRDQIDLRHYSRLWIFVTVTTVVGLGLTVVLNVMHAPPTVGARIVGGTPPVFVLFCLELISRIPQTNRFLSVIRVLATVGVVGLAFYLSYEQQRDFIRTLGFSERHAAIYPLIIDGAMVVSTLSLVEVSRRVRELRSAVQGATLPTVPAPVVVAPAVVQAELAGQRFRDAAARMRGESAVASLNGKPDDAPQPVAVAA